jgi:glycosyltransferase involved in cell wall biosynthesis
MAPVPASVLWLGLLEGPSGYADEARGFLRALERAGEGPAARPVLAGGGDAMLAPQDRAMLAAQAARSPQAARVAVHHYAPAWLRSAPEVEGMANVARTMFETDRVPAAWLPQLLGRDEVWVPSPQGAEAFERGGVPASRLRVVGGTLDFDLYRPGLEPLALPDVPAGHQVFLSTFEFTERKAWRQLLAAWARAFAPDDEVCLVLKASARGDAGRLRARVAAELERAAAAAGRAGCAPVRVLTETLSSGDLARLYAAADAYVLPSRGEGWGRPYMEAMAMGVPTVASRFSGNLAFMSDATSWLVDGELVAVPADHETFADDVAGHRWFEPDVEALAGILVELAAAPAAARAKAALARPDLLARFGPEATAATLRTALSEVAERHGRLGTTGRAVVLRGPFGRHQSLGIVNDRLLGALEDGGRRVAAAPEDAPAAATAAPSVSHAWPPDLTAASAGPSVVILPWEYGDPPLPWRDHALTGADRVVVPSAYVRDGYVAAGMPPGVVEVVPNGVDLDRFTPAGPRLHLERRAACVFLFVGGTIWRKGIDHLLTAWVRAFGPDDDVLLVVKSHGTDSSYRNMANDQTVDAVAGWDDAAPVLHLTDHLAPEDLPALYRAADVLVAPYRGEGFGLPLLEAMACGVPVVHTGVGPSREFVTPGAGWAVPARRGPLEGSLPWPLAGGDGYVHEVDVDGLVAALRDAAADPAGRTARGARAAQVARGWGWDAAAARMEHVLADLEAEALAPIRTVAPERPEGRGTLVAYAPDWDDAPAWRAALGAWVGAVPADADCTLALAVREDRAGAVAEDVMAFLDGLGVAALPDLALHSRPDDDPLALVAGADAVLLDAGQAVARPPALVRRAGALVDLDGLGRWAADLKRLEHLSTIGP